VFISPLSLAAVKAISSNATSVRNSCPVNGVGVAIAADSLKSPSSFPLLNTEEIIQIRTTRDTSPDAGRTA
jgi:hypothetical protein